jgi:hypothetical protein
MGAYPDDLFCSEEQQSRVIAGALRERKKDYIHPALRADEAAMLSKPQKCHLELSCRNQKATEAGTTSAWTSGVAPVISSFMDILKRYSTARDQYLVCFLALSRLEGYLYEKAENYSWYQSGHGR